jgi:predicted dienelactone hydrolase
MRRSAFLLATAFCLATTTARAAGVRFFDVPAAEARKTLAGAAWYPCGAPQEATSADGRTIIGTKDCPLVGTKRPLVVISHGREGWFGGHHATAAALADAGFIVAAISHPGDNASDKGRVDDLSVLVDRPADIKRLIDFMLGVWPDAPKIDRERIGLFGFSMGGYTGMVVIGAEPDFRKGVPGCEGNNFRACEQLRNNELPTGPLTHDPRVKAAVIVDPSPSIFFPADSLKAVKVPIQLWSSDPKLSPSHVSGCCGLGLRSRLPSSPDFHLASNAIHFSFLPPCSAAEMQQSPRICVDAPGFDRVAFHRDFGSAVLSFFRKYLLDAGKP